MKLLYYNCTFALFIFRLHKLGIEAHAYTHYTSLLCFAFALLFSLVYHFSSFFSLIKFFIVMLRTLSGTQQCYHCMYCIRYGCFLCIHRLYTVVAIMFLLCPVVFLIVPMFNANMDSSTGWMSPLHTLARIPYRSCMVHWSI